MKKILYIAGVILIIILGIWYFVFRNTPKTPDQTAVYSCDNDKIITVMFYNGDSETVEAGEMSKPTGSVDVSLDGATPILLKQTISASGVRYANKDESLVFWNKGSEALIMRGNTMDLLYSNCVER